MEEDSYRPEDELWNDENAELYKKNWMNVQNLPDYQKAEKQPCDHHFVSQHKPGHQLYWVKICSFCHEPDWAYLDEAIDTLMLVTRSVTLKNAIMWVNAAAPEGSASHEPPPLHPRMWEIVRYDVLDGGNKIRLWWAAIPARPSNQEE